MIKRIGMLTSGGDCQALNATMRGLYPVELPSISGVDVWVLRNRNL